MKKQSILFLSLAISAVTSAQNDQTLANPNKDSLSFKKNELSINMAPVVKILMNTSDSGPIRHSITYKRNLNTKSALRLSLMLDRFQSQSFVGTHIVLSNDTLVEKVLTESPAYSSPHINLGYERLFGKRKLRWFYGTDIAIGYAKINSRTYKNTGSNIGFALMSMDRGNLTSSSESKEFSIGLSPFFGLKYPVSKRFSLSLQLGFDAAYKTRTTKEVNQNSTYTFNKTSFDIDLNTGILNDISLVYRF